MDGLPITESIFRYAECATAVEGKVQALEDRLNQLKIGNHQPPPPPLIHNNMQLRAHTTCHTSQKLGFHPPSMFRTRTSTNGYDKKRFSNRYRYQGIESAKDLNEEVANLSSLVTPQI